MSNQISTVTTAGASAKKKLPIAGQMLDVDAELKKFEEEERKRLGLDGKVDQWVEDMVGLGFKKSERAKVTLLIGGLTVAQDYLIEGALKGIGYQVQMLDCPTTEGFQTGKEFGNRGQCNPTYFTVGNLVQYLITLRDKHGMTAKEVVDKFVFLTAGACGPCRFGMYVTEYRKALRDAGFDGFRVMLFQQTGGIKQATGDEVGLELNPLFFWSIVKGMFAGDVVNAIGYRLRPYEVVPGATNEALEKAKKIVYDALESRSNIMAALWKAKPILAAVEVDKTRVKPKVSIIGEFWAMTTEGDGNYQLQSFLEQEGAECDIQFVTNWLLFMLWEGRYDTKLRAELRGIDEARKGLKNVNIGKKLIGLFVADTAIRAAFHTFGAAIGYRGYHLPDMDQIAETANAYYNNQVRGGEGHMEVGKFILNVLHNKAHMTLSVKPFGCMPSSGVSDGIQSLITSKYPQSIFCAIETSGDGKVNVQSRVQMFLFKARLAAQKEYAELCAKLGTSAGDVRAFLGAHPELASGLRRSPHAAAGSAADRLAEVAPYLGKTDAEIRVLRAKAFAKSALETARELPGTLAALRGRMKARAPILFAQAREEWVDARPLVVEKLQRATTRLTTPPWRTTPAAAPASPAAV